MINLSEKDMIFKYYSEMRKNGGTVFDNTEGVWKSFSYEHVRYIFAHDELFSSDPRSIHNQESYSAGGISFITMDNPDHKEMRNVTAHQFLPSTISRMKDSINETSSALLSRIDRNSDLISEYAVNLPVTVISEMLGIPEDKRSSFKEWSDFIIGNRTGPGFMELNQRMVSVLATLLQKNDEDSLLSFINKGRFHGTPLSMKEKIEYVMLLIIGGNETTTNLIGNMLRILSDYQDMQNTLRENRNRISEFVEESLRFYSPIQYLPHRFVRDDTEIDDIRLKRGDQIFVYIGSANRDESFFEDPDSFIPGRKDNRHIAFGNGVHMCIGAPLARLEAGIALEGLLDKFQRIEIDHFRTIPIENSMVYGFESMPLKN